MYGFERTSRSNQEGNGDFEALVINFANEKLQQVTTQLCFTLLCISKSEIFRFFPQLLHRFLKV